MSSRHSPMPPLKRSCLTCGSSMSVPAGIARRGYGVFCSRGCASVVGAKAVRESMLRNAPKRLWARLRGVSSPDSCWEWTGHLSKSGYGLLNVGGSARLAHRFAYELSCGEIPQGLVVCHRCDNPICCNPKHLFVGTPADNVADCIAKGRFPRGEKSGTSKLSEDQVRRIRTDGRSQVVVADAFGVSQSLVSAIKTGKRWSHVAD